ncbi:MAG: hypothetical protein AAGJ87_03590, partial [Pseudomonadota bacterium]
LNEYYTDEQKEDLFAATAVNNTGSIINIGRAGFRGVDTLPSAYMKALNLTKKPSDKLFFLASSSDISVPRRVIKPIVNKGGINKGARFLPLKIDILSIRMKMGRHE